MFPASAFGLIDLLLRTVAVDLTFISVAQPWELEL